MDFFANINAEDKTRPFSDYTEYMDCLFACVNSSLNWYLTLLKQKYAVGEEGYKNIFYPDLEIAQNLCQEKIYRFSHQKQDLSPEPLFAGDVILRINTRAACTVKSGIELPFYDLCERLSLNNFTIFCLACGIMASCQTDYAAVFQLINENGNLPAPTVESGAKLYFGNSFSITKAYGDMSLCLEELAPLLDLNVPANMPFSAEISLDKRMTDYLFGKNPRKMDERCIRFFSVPKEDASTPVMANHWQLEALERTFENKIRFFLLIGDAGSGRKFFVTKLCKKYDMGILILSCKKLFSHDYEFVDKVLWAFVRECLLTNSCCCLDELIFQADEKDQFLEYLNMALTCLTQKDIPVFILSQERLPLNNFTEEEVVELEFAIPGTNERKNCWHHFSKGYSFDSDVDFSDMAAKFLFTPGKIKSALYNSSLLSTIYGRSAISKNDLFSGCYNQISSDLTQKAIKMKTHFSFDDIVMNQEQKEIIKHAIQQVNFHKQIYEDWNYRKKYPYGQGMSILLFGAPGTGKSMCAQIIAHELNLELYRVDLSKVMDKYIGETEKSISKLFHEAKKCNVVLFFDECDALFAKRSDDNSSMQAFHNTKAALLLQEIEAYDGVSILATNHKNSIDPAFFRRMKYVVEFQFPDAKTREMLWRNTIPEGTPLGDDVDIPFLAERFEFAGGNIKNCILNAAFLAASEDQGEKVHMRHYLKAIRYEYIKTGKIFTKTDFQPYAHEVFDTSSKPAEMEAR
ncbi:MAG: ATP-binding protein [Roseburia sp.]|nr:ATP-binding protein [Roseburia sp.]